MPEKEKICKYKTSPNCMKAGPANLFHGNRCYDCNLVRHNQYYEKNRDDLLHRSNRRYANKKTQETIDFFEKEFAKK